MPHKSAIFPFAIYLIFAHTTLSAEDALRARNDAIIVRAVQRMEGYDYANDTHVIAAIHRHMNRVVGTQEYLDLAKQFRPEGIEKQLQAIIISGTSDNAKTEAMRLLLDISGTDISIKELLQSENRDTAANTARTLGLLGNESARKILCNALKEEELAFDVKKLVVTGLARNGTGQNAILQLVSEKTFPADMRLLAGGLLARSNNENIRTRAGKLLPQPQQKNAKPLASIDQLAGMKGDITSGRKLFESTATCSNCHIVNRVGKDVGPDLSEIGSKLSREAMYTAILDPSAGISHNYENYSVLTLDGQVINGLKISDSEKEIVIRTAEAIDRRLAKENVEQIKKSEKSIMPENLHHTFDQKGLVDIVEYMTSLTKK